MPQSATALRAVLRQRCPQCRQGPIFRTATRMHAHCPVCGLAFEREEGYFLGAMYVSYALSCLWLGLGMLAVHLLWPDLDLGWAVLAAVVVYLPFVPLMFRYSRVIWIYFDRWAWPEKPVENGRTPQSRRTSKGATP